MIQLTNIRKVYNEGKANECCALKNISFSVKKGEMVGIVGKSGAGKSTLLHILSGIDQANCGEYRLGDSIVSQMKEKQLAKFRNSQIGLVMQDFALIDGYTARENVMIPLVFAKMHRRNRKELTYNILEKIGIADLAERPVQKMSGGQKQRVAIARALVNNPDLILADEPTGALDSKTAQEIMKVFHELHDEGKTIIVVTHDTEIARQCSRIFEILDGEIEERVII